MDETHEAQGWRWTPIPPAQDEAEVRRRHEANRAAWNEGAQHYTAGNEERIAALRAGQSTLHPVERAMLGDLRTWCETAVHLQCASGQDTLSLWLEGAKRVIGVDISDTHIENARLTSEALAAPAEWYRCDILDTPHELDGTADLVFTGRGAIDWIHDIQAWARVCARLLRPDGVVSVFDNHPVVYFFDPDAEDWRLLVVDYFGYAESSRGWGANYIGETLKTPTEQQAEKFERAWIPSEVFGAFVAAGLTVEHFGEHPDDYHEAFPNIPKEQRKQVPHTFSMLARKPRA
jgi:SAM-dependent methyltransferase